MISTTLTPANAVATVRRYGGLVVEPVHSLDRGLVLGIYSPGGAGKTTLAATVADSDLGRPALYLNARGNPHVISSYGDGRIDMVTIEKFTQVEQLRLDVLKDKDFPYRSVIFDNLSELFHMDLRDRYGPMGVVEWTKHSATTSDMLQLVRAWTDMAEFGLKLNVIFVFQEAPEARTIRGQEVKSRSEIAFNKALQFQIPTIVNFLGRLYIAEDVAPYRRVLDFSPVESVHQAKLQIDPSDEFARQIPFEVYQPSLASILDTVRGHKPWPVAKHSKRGERA